MTPSRRTKIDLRRRPLRVRPPERARAPTWTGLRRRRGPARPRSRRCCGPRRRPAASWSPPAPSPVATDDRPARRRAPRHGRSARTSCWSRSARAASASSSWPSRPQPVRRKVALKVLKPGMDTRQVVARFEAERQALAIMDHPNIAKVFDGGATPSGRPYFVMELVKGVPITEFCDQNHLTPRQRLELFVAGLPGGAARPPEGDHPPRPQAVQRPGHACTTRRRW